MNSSPWIWHLLHNVKLPVKISSIFVVFLENMNFGLELYTVVDFMVKKVEKAYLKNRKIQKVY